MSEALLRDYLKSVESYYKMGIATEHTYRPTLQKLLNSLISNITVLNEPKRVKCGAPDYAVLRDTDSGTFTVGYVEAKDIGISLDKTEHSDQMGRYLRALDNLVLTDYVEFRWYVKGERHMIARLATPHGGKSLTLDKEGTKTASDLLCSFLKHSAEPIRKPEELAKRMARLAHMIRDVTVTAFEKREASDTLNGLYEAFKAVLLPDLPTTQFADMFAQTLAYGLFAARYNHKGKEPFNRRDAAKEIPRTNPCLRKLFLTIEGADFDDEPFIGFVNELTQVLGVTDMDAVLADFGKRTRQEDPIVHFYETFLAQYDPKLRELAYLKASQVNQCKYCQHYHTGAARKVGLSETQLQALGDYEQSSVFGELEKLVLRFAEQWTRQGKADAEVVSALSQKLSPSQLIVLAATVGLANWTNRFNETFGVELP